MEGMMKCGIYKGIKQVAIEERPIPQIDEKGVLVKVLRAGICGSDTGAYLHGGMYYGVADNAEFGHEMVGKVVEKGSEVEGIELGDIVFVEPTCAKKAGIYVADMCGGFSEYVNVEDAKLNHNIYVWNKDVNLDEAVLAEPLAVGTNGVIMQEPGLDEKVVVLGAGTIGLSAAAGLIARGLKNVAVVDINETRLEMAKELGAIAINGKDGDLKEQLINVFGAFPGYHPQPDVDMYVDAAGAPALLSQTFNFAREGSRYVVLSVYGGNLEINPGMFIRSQAKIYGSRGYMPKTIVEVMDHITNKKTPIGLLVTKKYKPSEFVEAMAEAASGRQVKVIIDYEME